MKSELRSTDKSEFRSKNKSGVRSKDKSKLKSASTAHHGLYKDSFLLRSFYRMVRNIWTILRYVLENKWMASLTYKIQKGGYGGVMESGVNGDGVKQDGGSGREEEEEGEEGDEKDEEEEEEDEVVEQFGDVMRPRAYEIVLERRH